MRNLFIFWTEQDLTAAPVLPLVVRVSVVILFISMPRYTYNVIIQTSPCCFIFFTFFYLGVNIINYPILYRLSGLYQMAVGMTNGASSSLTSKKEAAPRRPGLRKRA